MIGGNNILNAQLPVGREVPAVARLESDRNSTYRLVQVTFPNAPTPLSRTSAPFNVDGDTLTVLELDGEGPFGIALGKGAQFIPVEIGTVLTRTFSEFTVRTFGTGATINAPTLPYPVFQNQVLVAVSYGPLITRTTRLPDFAGRFPIFKGLATAIGVDLWGGIVTGVDPNAPRQLLKHGGTMMIRNLSLASMLRLYFGQVGSYGGPGSFGAQSEETAWDIFPQEVLTITAKSRLSSLVPSIQTTLCLASDGGSVPYNFMLSGWGDAYDADSRTDRPLTLEYSR